MEPSNSHEQETVVTAVTDNQTPTKRKLQLHKRPDLEVSLVSDDSEWSIVKKPKLVLETSKAIQISDSDQSDGDTDLHVDRVKNVIERREKCESSSSQSKQVKSSNQTDWKPIERELYLKGVEIFGKNR